MDHEQSTHQTAQAAQQIEQRTQMETRTWTKPVFPSFKRRSQKKRNATFWPPRSASLSAVSCDGYGYDVYYACSGIVDVCADDDDDDDFCGGAAFSLKLLNGVGVIWLASSWLLVHELIDPICTG